MKKFIFILSLAIGLASCGKKSNSESTESGDSTSGKVAEPDSHSFTSIHHEHQELYNDSLHFHEAQWDQYHNITHALKPAAGSVRHKQYKVFGWHPSYMGSAYKSYDFNLLWGIGYFSYEVNPATGNYKTIYDWKTTQMIDMAKKAGTKVFLTVTNFGPSANTQLLNNPKATQTLIDSVAALLKYRKADGISVDFEMVSGSSRNQFTAFLISLSTQLKKINPDWQIALALYTVDWSNVFEIQKLNPYIDLYTLMGYDYYYTGSPTAGPVSPLSSGKVWAPYSLEKSVDYFLGEGVVPEKLILGLPYYGRSWYTEAKSFPSKNLGYISSPAYRDYAANANLNASTFDTVSCNWCYPNQLNGKISQLWFSDVKGLSANYDYVKAKGLGGIGIWALGYDNGRPELWNLLKEKFTE
jgi:spore germination protein YaaH